MYRILEPEERTLEVRRLRTDSGSIEAILATGGQVRPIEGEDELVLDPDALWARWDALNAEERARGVTLRNSPNRSAAP